MYAIIDTKTLRAIWNDVKMVKDTGKLPKWMYNGMCWSDSREEEIMVGAAVVCWYEFCLQSMEPAKPLEDWCRALPTTVGFSVVQDLIKAELLKHDYVREDLTIRHSRNVTRKRGYRTILQPQVGRRYEHRDKHGFSGLTVQNVISILRTVGVCWKRGAGV